MRLEERRRRSARDSSAGGGLRELVARTCSALQASSLAVLLVDSDASQVRLVASAGLDRAALGRSFELEDGLVGRAIASGETVSAELDEPGQPRLEYAAADGGVAVAVPIRSGATVDGAVCAVLGDGYDERDLALVETAAESVAGRLEQEGAERLAADAAEATVAALGELLDLRDGYVSGDAHEVVRLAVAIGRRLRIEGDALADLALAARVHEIGKLGVPDRILHKAGKLDDDERTIMQRHAIWGAQTLARLPGLERVAELVRSHHERWDGRGYPARQRGEEIPLGSRIIGACDAYRAMTSERPYRRALPPERAAALIKAAGGSLFDPAVVDELLAVLAEEGIRPASAEADEPSPALATGRASKLGAALERLDSLPVLVESRQRLLELLRDPHPSTTKIVQVVESDVALTVALLRLANAEAREPAIGSVPAAVSELTPQGVEVVISRMVVTDFFDRRSGWSIPPNRFRLHALAVRDAAMAMARLLGYDRRDELVAAALLHDIGKLVLVGAHVGYPDSYHRGAQTPEDRLRAERRELGLDHAAVGGIVIRRWGLPDELARAVEQHHMPDAYDMAALLRLADLLVHFARESGVTPRALVEAGRGADLDENALRSLMYELSSGGAAHQRRGVDPSPLTAQETAALRGLAEGKLYKEVALDMGLSTSTVRSHLHKAYGKLGVPDRAQAVLIATDRGWI